MNCGDYTTKTIKSDFLGASKLIDDMSDNITYYNRFENSEVKQLPRKTVIGLLPNYADTYGYSVREAQAAGYTVISSDIRALPEINNKSIGWILNFPKDEFGIGRLNSGSDRKIFSERLKSQLIKSTQDILASGSEQINTKGNLATEKIRRHYNPCTNAKVLKAIYHEFSTL